MVGCFTGTNLQTAESDIASSSLSLATVREFRQRNSHTLLVLICAILTRSLYLLALKPMWCPDSVTYTTACSLWATHFFTDGARTPLYPLLLGFVQTLAGVPAISSLHPTAGQILVLLQSAMGVIACVMLHSSLRLLEVRPRIALPSALFFCILYAPPMYEQAVLTESLSLFCLVLLAWLAVVLFHRIHQGLAVTSIAIATGAILGCSILARPENVIIALAMCMIGLVVTLRIHFLPDARRLTATTVKSYALIALTAAPLVLGWMTVNYIGLGQFRLTTMTGWQMSQAVYNLWDKVDPEDRALGNILSRSYERRAEGNRGDRRDHFWLAFDELTTHSRDLPLANVKPVVPQSAIGAWLYSIPSETSRVYTHRFTAGASIRPTVTLETPNNVGDYIGLVSRKLMRKYPGIWFRNASTSFLLTFNFNYWQPSDNHPVAVSGGSVIRFHALWSFETWLDRVQAPILTVMYFLTLVFAFLGLLMIARSSRIDDILLIAPVVTFAMATLGTMTAYCLFAGYDTRYSVPHLGTVVLCSAISFELALSKFHRGIPTRHQVLP